MIFQPSWRPALTLALAISFAGAAPALTSCSSAERQEASANTQNAYSDFKTYVETAESDVQRIDMSDTEFSADMNRAKADYDAKLAAAERDMDQFTAEQKADIEALKTRYSTAYDQREAAYRSKVPTMAVGKLYTPVAPTYASIPAAGLRATYEQFVQTVKANENQYEIADWQAVNADWKALNARKEQVEDQLSTADKAEIAKEKIKYAAFKTFDKSEARASEGAAETKDAAYKTGRAIGEGANKAGQVIDRGAEKVGNAAKGAYKGARDGLKSAEAEREGIKSNDDRD